MEKFNVTIKETKKYNPVTRTITVEAQNKMWATRLVLKSFHGYEEVVPTPILGATTGRIETGDGGTLNDN
jgi:hypothetical protein